MRESCTYGSVRGALSNERPYRDRATKRAFTPAFAGYARRAHASREKRESAGTLWLGACTTRDRGNYRENGVEIVGLDGSLNRSVALLLNL
jgi:hypothetical protein